ncbi:phenylalanine--tRNA ligase subunit beta [Candidatus Peregrinibacteria bacterium]|nr:phenylalanine--tRNA ligase subunit beta [Candidatus Peregrinibacteria bacterium]
MQISLSWLKDFVDISKNLDPKILAEELTLKTAEVEQVINEGDDFANMVTGKVVELKKHPDADKLKIATVDIGEKKPVQIVCGGANLENDMYVAITKPGSYVRWHGQGDLVEVKKIKIRGIESTGMIAASSEIGLNNPDEGPEDILNLAPEKPAPGTPMAEFLEKSDIIFEFDNKALTHRPDLWGHYGIAREVAAITNKKLKPYKPKVAIPQKGEEIKAEILDHEYCPRFCALIINNVKVEESPVWLKRRLKNTGHGTHNNIVDVTNYVMTELGHPMHAFDKSLIDGGFIIRPAKKGEILTTLDGKKRELTSEMVVVADHKNAIGLGGIMGGQSSEIKAETTSVILEAANWHPSRLRRTAAKLNIRTDAVQRFEKALDPNLAETAILKAAELILQLCPNAQIGGPMTDIKDPKRPEIFKPYPRTIELDTQKAASKIGIDISPEEMIEILEKLGFKAQGSDEYDIAVHDFQRFLKVQVPSHRATKDITIEDDLIEEIARIYGYENIPADLPSLPIRLPMDNTERFKKHRLRELLSYGLGFDEVMNYSFYSKSDFEKCLIDEEGHLKIENYLSEDQTHLRTTMSPNLLKNAQLNAHNFDNFKLYEIGHTYKEIGQYFPLEEKRVTGIIVKKGKTDSVFYEAKGVLEAIFDKFNLKHIKFTKGVKNKTYAHPIKAISAIDQNAQTIGLCFTLHPLVAKNYDLENYSIAIFSVNLTEAFKIETDFRKFTPIPKFPNIIIDISVLIDGTTEIETIQKTILDADKELIAGTMLFDIYEGEKIEKGKKAVAFSITLQAQDRTLTDEEMTTAQNKIFKNLESLGGTIRGR